MKHEVRDVGIVNTPTGRSYSVRVYCFTYGKSFSVVVNEVNGGKITCPYCGKPLKISVEVKANIEE